MLYFPYIFIYHIQEYSKTPELYITHPIYIHHKDVSQYSSELGVMRL